MAAFKNEYNLLHWILITNKDYILNITWCLFLIFLLSYFLLLRYTICEAIYYLVHNNDRVNQKNILRILKYRPVLFTSRQAFRVFRSVDFCLM